MLLTIARGSESPSRPTRTHDHPGGCHGAGLQNCSRAGTTIRASRAHRRAVAAAVPTRPDAVPNRPDAASPAKDATQRNIAQYRVHSRSGTAADRCRHLLEPITASGSRNRRPTTKSTPAQRRTDARSPGSCCATLRFRTFGPKDGRRGRSPHPRSSGFGAHRRSLCDVHTRQADICRRRSDRPHRRNRLDGHRTTRGVTVQPVENCPY